MRAIVYDIETYPNAFTLCAIDFQTDAECTFEISDRRDDRVAMCEWLWVLGNLNMPMIGFNSINFDYPIVHRIMNDPDGMTPELIAQWAHEIITSGDAWEHQIRHNERHIPQIDLFRIHHFHNKNRRVSLKSLEFALRSESVQDLPFAPGTHLTDDQIDTLRAYNRHDVAETKRFALRSMPAIEFRQSLVETLGPDVLNYDDTKIGKQTFIQRIGRHKCYRDRRDARGWSVPRQTPRSEIRIGDVILPWIAFRHPEFTRVLEWLRQQIVTQTTGLFKGVSATIDGFQFDFSQGGLHASVKNRTYRRVEGLFEIVDLDVTSFYPSIAIVNRLAPAHLGEDFVNVYGTLKAERLTHPKGSPQNAALKLALNGVYGDSNFPGSPFYDPQYTMGITINGQLLLCMLVDMLITVVPGIRMIQANTDGITVWLPCESRDVFDSVCADWQAGTALELEETQYQSIFIRDVNNYLAVDIDGKVKRKNAFNSFPDDKDYDGWWHKDFSALVVPRAVESELLGGMSAADFVMQHDDPFDFMLLYRCPRGSKLTIDDVGQQQTLRYFIAYDGGALVKTSPPVAGTQVGQYKRAPRVSDDLWRDVNAELAAQGRADDWDERIHTKNRSTHQIRTTGINVGWGVAECNHVASFDWSRLNRNWYVEQAERLVASVSGSR